MNEQKELEKSIEETVEEMKKKIDEITQATKSQEPKIQEKVSKIAKRSITVLNESIEKLTQMAVDIKNSEEFKNTLTFIKNKSCEVGDATVKKIKDIKDSEEFKKGVANVSEAIKNGANFAKEKAIDGYKELEKNDNVKKVIDGAGKKLEELNKTANDFINKPSVADKIDKAKDTTIDLAEKALEGLKKWLKPEDHHDGDSKE